MLLCCQLHLPYFNLADGSKSTDASLVIEVILSQGRGQEQLPPIDSGDQPPRSSLNLRREALGNKKRKHDARSSKIVAGGDLDVQTTLLTGSHGNRALGKSESTLSGSHNYGVLELSRTKLANNNKNKSALEASGTTIVALTMPKDGASRFGPGTSPRPVAVRVGLSFSKAPQAEERITEERNGPRCVPTFFVVATTLFDCATAMNEAELGLYARYAHTGDLVLLSSDERGAIGEP